MSGTDYATLLADRPKLAPAARTLQEWLRTHPHLRYVDPRRLQHEMDHVSISDLVAVLALLSERGHLRPAYKLERPDTHSMTRQTFGTLDEIPEVVEDLQHNQFRSSDADVITVFQVIDD